MFCHKCGNQAPEDAAFCHKCGTVLHNEVPDTTAPEAEPSETAAEKVKHDVLEAETIRTVSSAAGATVVMNKCSSDGDNDECSSQILEEDVSATIPPSTHKSSSSENAKRQKKETKKSQTIKPDNPGSFPLFGQIVNIPIELSNYNVFHLKYENMTEKIFSEFPIEYKKKFSNIEQVLAGYLTLCENYLSSVINAAVDDLVYNKVMDIDANAFFELHEKRLRVFKCYRAFEELEAQYESILEDQASKNAYRTARRQNRGKWVGGGFGVEGAIKGAVQAGAFNAVGGLTHGTANVIGGAFSAVGASVRKASLFNDSNIFKNLHYSLVSDCDDVVHTLVELLKKNGNTIRTVNAGEEKKAEAMFKNLSSPSFPASELFATAVNIILTNPYEEKYYHFLIDNFHDESCEVESLAKYFGLNITAYKSSLVRKYYNELPNSTYEEIMTAKKKAIEHSKSLGGVPKDLMSEIDSLIETRKNEKIRSLFKSHPKGTLEELLACRDKIVACCKEIKPSNGGAKVLEEIDALILKCKNNMAMKLYDSLPKVTEDEILESKKSLLKYCDEIKLTHDNPAVAKINVAFQKLDKDIRTIEGIEFKSREEANAAKDEKGKIEAIIARHELIFRRDYVAQIDEIMAKAHSTAVSDIYIRQQQAALKKFDKKCRRAARYNYRKGKKLRIYSGDIKISLLHWGILLACFISLFWGIGIILLPGYILYLFLFSRKKEKRLWNELTHKGKYDLTDIISQKADTQGSKEVVGEYIFCIDCGTKLPNDALFCDSCGTAQKN